MAGETRDVAERTEALEEHLYSLDLRPAQLRSDPLGETWLGEEWFAAVVQEPELRGVLRRFVEEELELYDSVRGQADAFFTARVIEAASPMEVAGAGLAPRYRSWVLASAYALALGTASMLAIPWLKGQGYVSWSALLHEFVSHELGEASESSWLFIAVAALAIVAVGLVAMKSGERQESPRAKR
jgi:hypothetical protein